MPRSSRTTAALLTATLILPLWLAAQDRPQGTTRTAGPTDGGFLLPNGWTVSPAGDQVALTDLPLNIIPLDSRLALVATSGYNDHELSLVDLDARKVVDAEAVRQSWYGLAVDRKGGRVWWSGGGGDRLHAFRLDGRALTRTSDPEPQPEAARPKAKAEAKPKVKMEGPGTSAAGWRCPPTARRSTRSTSTPPRSPRWSRATPGRGRRRRSACGPMTSRSRATGRGSTSPTGPAAPSWRSTRSSCARSPGSRSASIPTRSPSTRRTTACSSPAPPATAWP